ncbi:hypothetical protein [Nonomuraea wenchangensis]|uniref:hypothetical protein n=1 Tax=Nonomuraea wenchangensis TaxID=568860 RepID=UPI0033E01F11
MLEFKVDRGHREGAHIMYEQAMKATVAALHDPERAGIASKGFRQKLAELIYNDIFALGRLQPFVDDPEVESIDVNGCDRCESSTATRNW